MTIHENLLNIEMGKTAIPAIYEITAETCEGKPNIIFNYNGLTEKQVRAAIRHLSRAFRKIIVIDNEMGEVVYDHYEGDEFFRPIETPAEAIDGCMVQINNYIA